MAEGFSGIISNYGHPKAILVRPLLAGFTDTSGVGGCGMYLKKIYEHGIPLWFLSRRRVLANKSKWRGCWDSYKGVGWYVVPVKRSNDRGGKVT